MRKVLIVVLILVVLVGIGFFAYQYVVPSFNAENRSINSWIKENNLNEFGDAQNTAYSNKKPCDSNLDCFDYIKKMHPDKPWEK